MTTTVQTSLGVPAVAARPSPRCVQWTEDGQLIMTTKASVFIMTPEHGINFDLESILRSNTSKKNDIHIGWFRTMIQLDKTSLIKWPEYSQDWGAGSLGSIDTCIASVAVSPSCITPHAGCVIAVLTSNMDLSLWVAGKNSLKGEWIKALDMTQWLLKEFVPKGTPSLQDVLKLQIMCIAWTSQPDFQLSPRPNKNASLLICGSRDGSLTFVRYTEDYAIQHVETVSVGSGWIQHVAPSAWTFTGAGTCRARVAYGVAAGGVAAIEVTVKITPSSKPAEFGTEMDLTYEFSQELIKIVDDEQGVTTLKWIQVKENAETLVYCRPGLLGLWTDATDSFTWSGLRNLRFQCRRVSAGSSPFLPVSGIQYAEGFDALVVILFDGSAHVVHQLTSDPSWTSQDDSFSAESLSATIRTTFVKCESQNQAIADIDDNRTSGFISYDSMGGVAWLHEVSRTADFSYKHDAKLSSTLVVASLWQQDQQDAIKKLEHILWTTNAYTSPMNNLRPIFYQFRTKAKIAAMHVTLLKVLAPQVADHTTGIALHCLEGSPIDDIRHGFRRSLVQHLFGWDELLRLRMRLAFADYLWKMSDPPRQTELGYVAQTFLNAISHRVLRTILRHLAAVMHHLTPADVPFVLRMVGQSRLPESPPDLSSEGHAISEKIRGLLPDDLALVEHCPACKEEIPLQNITAAVCTKGHTWARCSITTFVLATPYVRTCIGCTRKAFLPPSSAGVPQDRTWLPTAGRGWVVEELLEAVHRCLFCSNPFVSVI